MGRFGAMMDGEWCGVDGCPMNVQRERERMMSKSGRVKRSNKKKKKNAFMRRFVSELILFAIRILYRPRATGFGLD